LARGRKVSIAEDYLVFLHEQLAENQAKLREILHDSGSEVVFNMSADGLVRTVEKDFQFRPIDGIVSRMKEWGMTVTLKREAGSMELELRCPYAETVHPQLTSKKPVCPLGEYALGALRLVDREVRLEDNSLLSDGARFRFRTSNEE
jgi:hypothetical protein